MEFLGIGLIAGRVGIPLPVLMLILENKHMASKNVAIM
jgi:hypothetical protein